MIRTHVPRGPNPETVEPRDQDGKPHGKPRGFWYEVDGDWRRWMTDDGLVDWFEGAPILTVTLGQERMLNIRTAAELDAFAEQYGELDRWYAERHLDHYMNVRWAEVAASYDGIEIAPYLWERRLSRQHWYYGWDCASGCIWRPRGVKIGA